MSPAAASSKLVLLVDDDETLLDLMTHLLKSEGFRTERAVDGVEALRKVEALKPDAILLDFMLPELGGLDAARELNKRGLGHIPIVAITGRPIDEDSIAAVKAEGNIKEFLQKPVKTAEVAAILHRLLGTEPAAE